MNKKVQGVSSSASTLKPESSPTKKSPSGEDDSLSKTCQKPGHAGWEGKCLECLKEFDAEIKRKFREADRQEQLDNINRWLGTKGGRE